MNKTLIFVNIIVILGLLLSACGGASVGIQIPGASSGDSGGQSAQNTTLFFVLIGAVVLIAVIALLSKK